MAFVGMPIGAATVSISGSTCVRALRAQHHSSLATDNVDLADGGLQMVIGAIKELLTENVITPQDLMKILMGVNPLDDQTTSRQLEFRPVVDQIIRLVQDEYDLLAPPIKKLIAEAEKNLTERTDQQVKTKDKFITMVFYPIAPGEFTMRGWTNLKNPNGDQKSHRIKIEKHFWIANVLVTQWQYAMVMGVNSSKFDTGKESIEHDIETEYDGFEVTSRVRMQPNHPVEYLSVQQENEFIARLNDLSKRNDPVLYKIIPDHKTNWRYRKPKDEEWEYVARVRGSSPTPRNAPCGAWYLLNALGSTRPVGELEPVLVDGVYPIYDMYGNVWERTAEGTLRGGSWASGAETLSCDYRTDLFTGRDPNVDVGIRLVAEPPP